MTLSWSMRKETKGLWDGMGEALMERPELWSPGTDTSEPLVSDIATFSHLVSLYDLVVLSGGRDVTLVGWIARAFDGFPVWPGQVRKPA